MGTEGPSADDAGFAAWVLVRRRGLRHTAFLLCGDWAAADDLVQDALLRVYPRWSRIAGGQPDAYVRTVLTSVFIDERRRPWRRERPVATPPEAQPTQHEGGGVDLAAALLAVPPRQRAVLVLRFWEDLSVEQAAAALGCSVGTVKSQTARGLTNLRRQLGDEITIDGEVPR